MIAFYSDKSISSDAAVAVKKSHARSEKLGLADLSSAELSPETLSFWKSVLKA